MMMMMTQYHNYMITVLIYINIIIIINVNAECKTFSLCNFLVVYFHQCVIIKFYSYLSRVSIYQLFQTIIQLCKYIA